MHKSRTLNKTTVVQKPKYDEDEFSTFHCDSFVMTDIVESFLQEEIIVGIL